MDPVNIYSEFVVPTKMIRCQFWLMIMHEWQNIISMKKVSHHWGINEAMEHSKWLLMEKLDVRDFNSNIIWLPEKKKFYHRKNIWLQTDCLYIFAIAQTIRIIELKCAIVAVASEFERYELHLTISCSAQMTWEWCVWFI